MYLFVIKVIRLNLSKYHDFSGVENALTEYVKYRSAFMKGEVDAL